MPLTVQSILLELRFRLNSAQRDLVESRGFGTATPGFNQDLGARDALYDFLKWLETARGDSEGSPPGDPSWPQNQPKSPDS